MCLDINRKRMTVNKKVIGKIPKTLNDTQVSVVKSLHTISFIAARNRKNNIQEYVAIRQPFSVSSRAGDKNIFKKDLPETNPINNIRARVTFIKVGLILIKISSFNAMVKDPKIKMKNKVIICVFGTFLFRI